ncbi:uncharacterized protein N7459_009024 [Penicillium hispanicum]|uniref:uncharacterized protein n=1 Tax=Penicillium hispanicum TaxID=1080232 RepID=UPI0025412E2E|nr:uncharacterized protein N7459_009024 [Penicillium hispanicum]KAJ5569594.1 hypothetical protein N7459_009024 [Penicillium hispanicum]
MPSNVYCPLCGVILLPDPYSLDPAALQTHARPWYAEVRGIYSTNIAVGHVTLTGLGLIHSRNRLHAPLDSDLSYVDVGTEVLEAWRICEPSQSRWCFGFHNSCWRLLLLTLSHRKHDDLQDETAVAESVFYQLYCTPCLGASIFQFGHDYEGAAQTHRLRGRPKGVDLESPFYADPCVIPSPEDLEAITSDSGKAHDDPLGEERDNSRQMTPAVVGIGCHDKGPNGDRHPLPSHQQNATTGEKRGKLGRPQCRVFDGLPAEIVLTIFSYLSFNELLNLRLVCRELALSAASDMLPQSYWRSRFLLGQEADFFFPNLANPRDWSRLFFGTRASLRAGLLPLVNRKRIRRLLEPVATLVSLTTVLRKGPYGYAFHPAEGHDGYFQRVDSECTEQSPQLIKEASSFSGHLASISLGSPLGVGCRVFYHRAQPFTPSCEERRLQIGVSTVQIGAQRFISGINLFPSERCNAVGRLVGYHNPAREKWIEIPSISRVGALDVAFCPQGLRGIKVVFTDSDSSGWIGDSNGPDIAYGALRIPGTFNQHCLLAGLDRFKIVYLGLGEFTNQLGPSLKDHSQDVIDLSRVRSYLWTPCVPSHENLRLSALLPSQPFRSFEPLINIDFGGPRGQLLQTLTRLVFYMASGPLPLVGIEAFYSDGTSRNFGAKDGREISFFVNGPKGERVNRIAILQDNQRYVPATGLGGLQVFTNYGRTTTFAPLQYRLNAAVELMPISPPGDHITGFVALKLINQDHFVRIGTQSQQSDEQPITPDMLDLECHQIPDHQIRYDEKFSYFIDSSKRDNYQTYASLKNVRRIQASTGIQGRCRSPTCISGLRIDYYNHPTPNTVGQWMDELDDAFEFSPDEEVRSLTVWLTPTGFSIECPSMQVGQVAAVHIETTSHRSVTFRSPDFHSLPNRMLQHQYQTTPDEKMTALSWVLNVSADCVRAVVSANGRRRGPILVPEQAPPPFDQVRKLYFEIQNDDGCRETIVMAEAYFRDRAIVGLVFVYASGARVHTGDIDTDCRRIVNFSQNGRIIGLSIVVRESQLTELEFEVERDKLPRHEKLRLSIDPRGETEYGRRCVWCKDRASAESYQPLLLGDRIYTSPDDSRLVGVCVGCLHFSHVGALYESEVHRETHEQFLDHANAGKIEPTSFEYCVAHDPLSEIWVSRFSN